MRRAGGWGLMIGSGGSGSPGCGRLSGQGSGQAAEITVGPGSSTRFIAEMRKIFPFRESLAGPKPRNRFIIKCLIFGTHFTLWGHNTNAP